jgi:hypothetical protein
MSANNKRRAARERHDSVLEIFDKSGKHIAWTGTLVDCSETGACFTTTRVLAVGDGVEARLRLLNKGALDISAHIVWRRKAGNASQYGLKFDTVKNIYPSGEFKKPG